LQNKPLVSVIIPSYNSERFIDETIASVLNQTYSDLEVIVIDDGSTDAQSEKISEWCNRDNRVSSFYQENNGVSSARNNGFNRSKGQFVAFLDSDDVWLSDNLSAKLDKFDNGDFGLVHSDAMIINEISELTNHIISGKEGVLINAMLEWKGTQIPGPSSILVKREVINKVGLFDTALSTSADQDFFFRVASQYKIGRVNKVTWHYRVHGSNMHKNIRLMERDVLYVYKKAARAGLFHSYWFKRYCFASMYLILALSWAGDGKNIPKGTYFAFRSFLAHPFLFISRLLERIRR
jgi:glycosyltransferase involved in cell wall biosynthesis